MGDLPAGTITMLFSDIEGSTALVSRLGDRYGDALSAHRALLRAAFSAWHGREMSTEADSFFVVFESASDAVACCLAAQRALAGHDWPDGAAVRVRMGLHSGEPARHEDGYIGMDVHRAARIAAAAHGGQVVLSEATRLLAAPAFPAGVSVRDLGFHRLKDIEAPERIYQLAGPGLREGFPPLKSLGAQASLPVPATPLVGRDEDLARLYAAVQQPGVRPLHVQGEHELPVPALEVPGGDDVTAVAASSAAQLFVQHAGMVRPGFAVTEDNHLLATETARVFRRMSVFAGGCDLDALAAVAVPAGRDPAGSDPLGLAAELQDVSLITVTEGADGEPRLGLLETIREYALERLEHDDDPAPARRALRGLRRTSPRAAGGPRAAHRAGPAGGRPRQPARGTRLVPRSRGSR